MQWFLLASNAERGAALIDQITRLASGRGVGMVNRTDEYGNSALYYAVVTGKPELAAWLLRHPAFDLGRSAEQAAEFLSRLEQGVISSSNWDEANKALALVDKAVRDAWPEDEGEKGTPQAIVPDRSRKATQAQSARKHVPRWETDPEERKAEWFRLARGKDGGKEVRRQMRRMLEIEPGLFSHLDASGKDAAHYAGKTGKRQIATWLRGLYADGSPDAALLARSKVADAKFRSGLQSFGIDKRGIDKIDQFIRTASQNGLLDQFNAIRAASDSQVIEGPAPDKQFMEAFDRNDIVSLRRLLRTPEGKKWALAAREADGSNLLQRAAGFGNAPMVEVLLEVNNGELASAKPGEPVALLIAAAAGRLDVVKVLLRHDRSSAATSVTVDGFNILLLAAMCGINHCVKYLLSWNGGSLAASLSNDGDTALILAARYGRETVVRTMIDHGNNDILDHHNKKNANALTMAAVYGHAAVVKMLLEARISLAWTANDDMTPLLLAAQAGHADVVRAFLESPDGKLLSQCVASERKLTALDLAEQYGHEEAAKVLREFDGGSLVRKPGQ
jgi:ankyrin repeat protein